MSPSLLILLGTLASTVCFNPTGAATVPTRPNIFFIVADDLGWNDVSWRDPDMHTPVLTKLAKEGVILGQSYVQPVCSPSRAAFMSGMYPFHVGLQHESLRATQKAYLPGDITTLPQHLKKLGYSTHMAGKWHLGFCNWKYTPTYRGFDTFVGFYNAVQDYYTHIGHRHGYDFRHNEKVYYAANGTYSANIFTSHIQDVVMSHNDSSPLFVYLPYQSVHGPLQVPEDYVKKYCSHVHNVTRRTKCGMIAALDEAVGNVTSALKARNMLDNTLILFSTDNGGPVHHGANNWPLRGSKATLWEGGTRALAFLHAPKLLQKSGYTYNGLIHAVDWLPTFVEAAGGGEVDGIDGVSQWKNLVAGSLPSPRSEFVYNIDELKNNSGLRQGKFKLLQGKPGHPDGWYPPPSLDWLFDTPSEDLYDEEPDFYDNWEVDVKTATPSKAPRAMGPLSKALLFRSESDKSNSSANRLTLDRIKKRPSESYSFQPTEASVRVSGLDYDWLEDDVTVMATDDDDDSKKQTYYLFDLEADPYEHNDVKHKYPQVFKTMLARLREYQKTLVPANFPPHDPASFPSHFNGVWSPGWC
ncbi:hypothetical protein BaRGS_00001262 [Batillaria attramentaria]|uniref:Sulfatase N-terminal domain-containing protein n=1 Tax=Batillaria attramentaria TaxID=370345 RepID=A0ABD0M7N3_9CAEN